MQDNKTIIVNEKRRVYVFKVNMLLKPQDIYRLRENLKEQIRSGLLVLPAGVDLINVTRT